MQEIGPALVPRPQMRAAFPAKLSLVFALHRRTVALDHGPIRRHVRLPLDGQRCRVGLDVDHVGAATGLATNRAVAALIWLWVRGGRGEADAIPFA